MSKFKLLLFDMDGTLLKERSIFVFAEKKGFMDALIKLIYNSDKEFYEKSIEIAKSLKGMNSKELLKIFREIPLNNHVENVIQEIKKKGIITAIVTDSYQFLADDLKDRLGINYAFANNLILDEDIVTGELIIHNKDLKKEFIGNKIYSICKSCVLEQLCKKFNINPDEVIAVGDGKVDICMLKKAGLGIAYKAPREVQKHADISTEDMREILKNI